MLKIEDVIKLKDGIKIKHRKEGDISFIVNNKQYNIRGEKVRPYILPIIDYLNQPNYLDELYKMVEDSKGNINDVEISEEIFLKTIKKLTDYGFTVIIDENYLFNKYNEIVDGFKRNQTVNERVQKRLRNKNILILDFLDIGHIDLLLNPLSKFLFQKIKVVDFSGDTKENYDMKIKQDIDGLETEHKYVLMSIQEENIYRGYDFVVSLLPRDNEKIRTNINKIIIKLNIPWLNCILNDTYVEVGPLIQYRISPCYYCYKSVNQNKNEHRNIGEIGKEVNKYIAFDLIIEDILKYFLHDILNKAPLTLGKIVSFERNELNYNQEGILFIPNCSVCGHWRRGGFFWKKQGSKLIHLERKVVLTG